MYHHKTIEILKTDKRFKTEQSEKCILENPKTISELPQAVWEWICLQNQPQWRWGENKDQILRFYSNDDHFWINEQLIWKENEEGSFLDEGLKIVDFATENQNNFLLGIVWNGNPDPAVMYTDYQEQRWVTYTNSFSEFIYIQIFDWQFKLSGKHPNWRKEIDEYGYIELKNTSDALEKFNHSYKKEPSNQYFWENEDIKVYRYSVNKTQRLIVYTSNQKDFMGVEILCLNKKDIPVLKNQILLEFQEFIKP
jgi:hypothetical protein